MKKLILGSQSEARRQILEKMGYTFDVIPADINEKAIRKRGARRLVIALAHAKATDILSQIPREKALLLTADQVVICGGRIYEKPETKDEVKEYFERYRVLPAEIVNGVVVTDVFSGERVSGIDCAKIWFRAVPDNVLNAYIESGDPFKHSGGFDYTHQIIDPYVIDIEGDPNSVSGLPVKLTRELLQVYQTD